MLVAGSVLGVDESIGCLRLRLREALFPSWTSRIGMSSAHILEYPQTRRHIFRSTMH